MSIDNLADYIIPLGLLLLYFFVSSNKKGKKKPPEGSREKTVALKPPIRREAPSRRVQPPVEKPYELLGSRLENNSIESNVSARQLNRAIKDDVSDNIVSLEMQKYSQEDLTAVPSPKRRLSRSAYLFKQKQSLRQAILIKEILTRPFE